MKALFLLLLVTVASCGLIPEREKVKECGAEPAGLSEAEINDYITDAKYYSTFSTVEPTVYKTGTYESRTYLFREYNETKMNWCYWYSITTNKNGKIIDIYVGNKN